MADRYEYKIIRSSTTRWWKRIDHGRTERRLNDLGAEGWEIEHIEYNVWGWESGHVIYLKRLR